MQLKKNNEHMRRVLNQIANSKHTDVPAPNGSTEQQDEEAGAEVFPGVAARFDAARMEPETKQRMADPAADGTYAYLHARSARIATVPLVLRTEAAKLPAEVPAPIYIDAALPEPAFTGVVVAIGLTEPDARLSGPLGQLAQDVAHETGIAPAPPDDGLILAYPADTRAHRSIFELSEYLWRLQLQLLGTSPTFLACGFVHVSEGSLTEAIDCACERMREVRRVRKMLASHKGKGRPAIYTSLLGRLLALRNSGKVRWDYHPEITVLLDTECSDLEPSVRT